MTDESKMAVLPPSITGEWMGHINNNPTKFKFDKSTLCGLVGQYQIVGSENWTNIQSITYKDNYLTLVLNIGVCEGFVAVNMSSGKYTPSNIVPPHVENYTSSWTMYR